MTVPTAEQIVRALAAADPTTYNGAGLAFPQCALCRAAGRFESEASHKPDCPWRQAVELVAQGGER